MACRAFCLFLTVFLQWLRFVPAQHLQRDFRPCVVWLNQSSYRWGKGSNQGCLKAADSAGSGGVRKGVKQKKKEVGLYWLTHAQVWNSMLLVFRWYLNGENSDPALPSSSSVWEKEGGTGCLIFRITKTEHQT